ncbi:MAG: hypothetical protein NW226_20630 [Microscillaceae bacterium]|nr:hypothetical protein [Microscillaceae bacterium]
MYLSFRIIYTLLMLAVISTDTMFEELGFVTYTIVISLSVPLSVLFFRQYTPYMRNWYILLSLYFSFCIFESYYFYNTPMKYNHVFAKIMVFYLIFSIYGFYKRFDKIRVMDIVLIYLTGFVLNAVLINSAAFSLSAFATNHRGLSSESVYGMTLVVVYFFNKYFSSRNIIYLLCFYAAIGIVLFLQHRTVWLCTGLALFINFLFISRSPVKIDVPSLIPVAISLLLMSMSLGVVIVSNEKVMARIEKSIEDISNPTGNDKDDEVSTSEWRYMQFQSYWPFVEERFLLGWRLEGFELPVQFIDPSGVMIWEDNTGHHFHSFYMDRLFYEGVLGLFLTVIPAFIYVFALTLRKKIFSVDQISLFAFIITGLLYGVSWDWQIYYIGILGYAIFKLEQNSVEPKPVETQENKFPKDTKNKKELIYS